ncbi:hypothetical protein [Candidatus Lokiarchaeum ossiferum]
MAASTAQIRLEDCLISEEHLPNSKPKMRWADELDFPQDEIWLRIRYQ